MKRISLVLFGFLMSTQLHSQTNTFPTTGPVGIGTTSPDAKLDVKNYGDGAALLKLSTERAWQFEQRFTGASSRLQLRSLAGSKIFNIVDQNNTNIVASFYARAGESCVGIGKEANYAYRLDVNGISHFSGSVFLATTSGNLGVGMSNPSAKLHVREPLKLGLSENSTQEIAVFRGNVANSNNLAITQRRLSTQTNDDWRGTSIRLEANIDNNANAQSWIEFRKPDISSTNHAIAFGEGVGGSNQWMVIDNGNVAIGTADPKGYKLAVAGKIVAEEVVVKLQSEWPDYVFSSTYNLRPLTEVEQHINSHGHLPDVPNAQAVKDNGIGIGEMNALLLQKIEELTLYLIEKDKENREQNERIKQLEIELSKLNKAINN